MINPELLYPRLVRLDASTVCQLKCPSCPTATGATGKKLGVGHLTFGNFKGFIRRNPQVAHIELSNWGEVFLNKDLAKILAYAYRHNVCMYIANGANLNHVTEEAAEALVKYKVRRITCSIDGASQETYVQYRIKGDFDKVIGNIRMINRFKAQYRSPYPQLKWQFVVFGHNEHEIAKAGEMAKSLDMSFYPKLSWADLYDLPEFSPVRNKERVMAETGLKAVSRKQYKEECGQDYVERSCCQDMWNAPEINFDGRMLGCPINYWGDYGNVFTDGLEKCLNNEAMKYARDMLMGKRESRPGIPCSTCKVYKGMKEDKDWVTEKDLQWAHLNGRFYHMLSDKILGEKGAVVFSAFLRAVREWLIQAKDIVKQAYWDLCFCLGKMASREMKDKALPNNGYNLPVPLVTEKDVRWKPTHLFRGLTKHVRDLSCHASYLVEGHCPHPPHIHKEDEILMMLSGEARLDLPDLARVDGQGPVCLAPGQFVYYPSGFHHTLRTVSAQPANYLMFKWHTPHLRQKAGQLSYEKYDLQQAFKGWNGTSDHYTVTLLEGPSTCLSRVHSHASVLAPGAGYVPHVDRYDVAIVLLEGELETLGQRFVPHSVIFHPAGQSHGLKNPGPVAAKYVVFEFER